MALDLNKLLNEQAGPILANYASSALGESAEGGQKAAAVAVPAVLGGLLHRAHSDANATEFFNLVNGPLVDRAWLPSLAGGDTSTIGKLIDMGKQWLPKLFGDRAHAVETEIAERSGVKSSSASTLLALAVPLILSSLRGEVQTHNYNREQLYTGLVGQRSWLERFLDNKLLAALGIPSIAALFSGLSHWTGNTAHRVKEEVRQPAAVTRDELKSASPGWLKWVALALGLLLLLWLLKSCMSKPEETPPVASAPAVVASQPVASAPASAVVIAPASEVAASAASAVVAVIPAPDQSAVILEDGIVKFYFATGKADIAKEAKEKVGDILAAAKASKKIVVSGYTDSTGSKAANEALSKKRALAVKAFLVGEGVPEAQIELRKPADTVGASGKNQEGRRVDVSAE